MSHSCFTHSSTDGHLGCFYILAIVNDAAMNIGVLMFFWISVLGSLGYILRVGLLGQKEDPFLIFEVSPYCFPQGLQQSAFPPTVKRIPLSPHTHRHILFIVLLVMAILTSVRWYIIVVSICISVMISDLELLFICLLTIVCPLWRNVYSGPLPIFYLGYFFGFEFYKFFINFGF